SDYIDSIREDNVYVEYEFKLVKNDEDIVKFFFFQAEDGIRDAKELRVKETDRILAVVEVLESLGATVEELEDGLIVYGKAELHGAKIKSYNDHRMAMMGAVASLLAKGDTVIDDVSSVNISYPDFFRHLEQISN